MHPYITDVGALVHCANQALPPASRADGDGRAGAAFTLGTFRSAVLIGNVGATTGNPAAVAITFGLESRTGEGTWAEVTDAEGAPVRLVVTAASVARELDLNLNELLPDLHDQVRVTEEVDLTAGTTPTILSSAVLVFGGGQRLPV